jgi:hypothetical protein
VEDITASAPGSVAGTLLGADALDGAQSDPILRNFSHQPLALGLRWIYTGRMRTRITVEGEPDVVTSETAPWVVEIPRMQTADGFEYYHVAEYDPRVVGLVAPQWALRADVTGVYQLDLLRKDTNGAAAPSSSEALAARFESSVQGAAANSQHGAAIESATASVAERALLLGLTGFPGHPGLPSPGEETGLQRGRARPGEATVLSYPLRRGSRWLLSEFPRFTRSVVGRERVRVPAGDFDTWVVRGNALLFGPNDRLTMWYAREGMVRFQAHLEGGVFSPSGEPLGVVIMDIDRALLEVGPGAFPL